MNKYRIVAGLFLVMQLGQHAHSLPVHGNVAANTITISPSSVLEGRDFASVQIGNPWDMSSPSPFTWYMNDSNQRRTIRDAEFSDGIFSGTSEDSIAGGPNSGNANIWPLFPGYRNFDGARALNSGNFGGRFPINSSTYKCLYFAAKVDAAPNPFVSPDQFRVLFFKDHHLNFPEGVWGATDGIALNPEAGSTHPWKLFHMNLSTIRTQGASWSSQPNWEGLRIEPTYNKDVHFSIDWIRLTDCNARNVLVSWSPNSSITTIYATPKGSGRPIRLASNLNGEDGSATIDVQGLAAGDYEIGLGDNTTCCNDSTPTGQFLNVRPSPHVAFSAPSPYRGEDFATSLGDAWDFANAEDIEFARNLKTSDFDLNEGLFKFTTSSGPPPGGIDAQIGLKMRSKLKQPEKYRYFSFRASAEWGRAWADVPDGMIARLIWDIETPNGAPCTLVSRDIPFDVGTHTYWFDMLELGSLAVDYMDGPGCPATKPSWGSYPITRVRFDPNENITCNPANPVLAGYVPCGDYRQNLDWIKLVAMESVKIGGKYGVRMHLKNSAPESVSFFYTSDRNIPNQQRMMGQFPQTVPPAPAPRSFRVAMPLILNGNAATAPTLDDANAPTFYWDTTQVAPGEYYVCTQMNDSGSTFVNCSEVPIKVVP